MRVVGNVMINIFHSNIFSTLRLLASCHLNCQAVLTAVSINCVKVTTPPSAKMFDICVPFY